MNTAVDFEEETKSVGDYVKLFKRRKKQMLVPASMVFSIAVAIALLLPSTYKSSATILIEAQQIPTDLVTSTVTTYAAQQIQTIKARIMTMKNIMGLVETHKLFSEADLKAKGASEIVHEFTKRVGLDVISAGVLDSNGRKAEATIAFSLSFEHSSPTKAQKVANEMVSLYLNENLRARAEQSSSTSAFLQQEVDSLANKLETQEGNLATFKQDNKDNLPALFQYNLKVVERTSNDVGALDMRKQDLQKALIRLESDLSLISPYTPSVLPTGERVLSEQDRLKALRARYSQNSALYSDSHPTVVRNKREIEALEKKLGIVAEDNDVYLKELREQEETLKALKDKYTDEHPKVTTQEQVVAALQEKIAALPAATESQAPVQDPDSPSYLMLNGQVESAKLELELLEEKRGSLIAKKDKYERFAVNAPLIEKEYNEMVRDLNNTRIKYQEIKAKQMTAELAKTLEQGRKGERFTLIDPPEIPQKPVSPNRPAIMFMGFVLAAVTGVVTAIFAEALSSRVWGARTLVGITGMQPLVEIPYLQIDSEIKKGLNKKYIIAGAMLFIVIAGAAIIHFFVTPLDVLWFKSLRRMP